MRNYFLLLPLWFVVLLPLWPQGNMGYQDDAVSYIGLTLADLYQRFGTPTSVYAARGLEEWQDDVVFVYDRGDFYIYKDRVWQVGLKAAFGIAVGDSRGQVNLILSTNQAVTNQNSTNLDLSNQGSSNQGSREPDTQANVFFYPLTDKAWPMMLRYDFDDAGKVKAIFIYRTDL